MLKQVILRGGASAAPMSLRSASRVQSIGSIRQALSCLATSSRKFAQSAAALQEPVGEASIDKNSLNREERVAHMETFIRKHVADEGSLPSAYVLIKEFGGARSTALRLISRVEEELKQKGPEATSSQSADTATSKPEVPATSSKPAVPAPKPAGTGTLKTAASSTSEATATSDEPTVTIAFSKPVATATSKADVTAASKTTVTTLSKSKGDAKSEPALSKRDASKPVAAASETKSTFGFRDPSPVNKDQVKSSDTKTLQGGSQGKATAPTSEKKETPAISLWQRLHNIAYSRSQEQPATAAVAQSPAKFAKPAVALLSSSESSSDEEDDSEFAALDFPEPDAEKNPGQSLLRSDLQPRHGLYVKFLHPEATEVDVRGAFRSSGEIYRVQIVKSRTPNAKYTYGFVDFMTEEGLKNALKKEAVIKGVKVQTEPSKGVDKNAAAKAKTADLAPAKIPDVKTLQPAPAVERSLKQDALSTEDKTKAGYTVSIENIPQSSLPQIVEALCQYGEVVNSHAKQNLGGNTTAFVEFKNEVEKDNALAAHYVHLGGKSLKINRIGAPLTTVVRLSNIPADAREKVVSSYKSFGQVDKTSTRMDGVVDIYYNANEMKNIVRILDKLNGLTVSKKKLRAVPAPVCYPKSLRDTAETPMGLKWIETQKELVLSNLETSLKKAAVYVQDLRGLLDAPNNIHDQPREAKSISSN